MQSNNRSSSNGSSPAMRLDSSPELGRYFVAGRAFKPGDVVMKEYPLAAAPGPLSQHVCFGCHRLFTKAYICSDCRSPLCNYNCQMSSEHQKECCYLKKIIPEIENRQKNGKIQRIPVQLSMLMLPLRLLLLRREQPNKWQLLMDLESHMEARKKTSIWGFNQRNITPFLEKMLIEEMPDINDDLVQQICGAIDVNSFEIRIEQTDRRHDHQEQPLSNSNEVLRGTFYVASLMAHSCIANAQISMSNDSQMTVKATVPIQEGEGIFVSYTDPLQTTLQRRTFLEKGKHFTCRCRRCQDPTEFGTFASAVRCRSCTSGWVLPHDDGQLHDAESSVALRWKCSECSEEIKSEDISRTEEVVQNIVKNIQRLPVDRHLIDRCEELFLTLPKKIHVNHVILLQLRISLVHLYGNVPGFLIPELPVSLLHRKAQLCSELLEALHHLCPGYSRLRGIVLYELHVPLVCLANRKFESGRMQQDQLIKELKDAEIFLKEAVQILIHEPVNTPESHIARAAMADLKQLREYVREMENLRRS
ncbi:hypothetical protein OUZ56_025152 [Daphnia magna]|uniref:SET domain-containing protein n=1 Tax=Daphnia magna TaxID=35525 RepID=A0ABQ9ZJ06_9CRUS|nr:hypothetical protein OUZ56_025152 [Daphnia magna]